MKCFNQCSFHSSSLYGESVAVGVVRFGDRVAAGSLQCTEHKIKMHNSDTHIAGLTFNDYNYETSLDTAW